MVIHIILFVLDAVTMGPPNIILFIVVHSGLQKTLSAKIYEAKYDEIISNAAPLDKSIMATLNKSKASFFSAPISSNGNRYVYNNLQLKNIFAFILGSPVYPISNNELAQCNTCGRQLLDPYGHHAVACSTEMENSRRHITE